ncbi:LOW QUALITY PROTEIN: hypothetical protein RJ639_002821 [Escallonia herrerae]|uniref:Uncharacterized protein n=1 Tax=Escallonia herrerae TaxID=1293975 RepID=A0AA89B158_9ASTE|nr:LOW QUALITY PROTEIN: hypothetical protein RJ639_002821 [Escallonia herrerae]
MRLPLLEHRGVTEKERPEKRLDRSFANAEDEDDEVEATSVKEEVREALMAAICVSRGEAYDKLQANMVTAKANLTKILTSKDVKATVCATLYPHDPKSLKCSSRIKLECFQLKSLYLVMQLLDMNELNRSLLALLDENISNANKGNKQQPQQIVAAEAKKKARPAAHEGGIEQLWLVLCTAPCSLNRFTGLMTINAGILIAMKLLN